jgi:hypothetical protein
MQNILLKQYILDMLEYLIDCQKTFFMCQIEDFKNEKIKKEQLDNYMMEYKGYIKCMQDIKNEFENMDIINYFKVKNE